MDVAFAHARIGDAHEGRTRAKFFDRTAARVTHRGPKAAGQFKVVEKYDTGEVYGLAMGKTNTGLIDAVNDALAKMKSDGDYQKIYDTYFATDQ